MSASAKEARLKRRVEIEAAKRIGMAAKQLISQYGESKHNRKLHRQQAAAWRHGEISAWRNIENANGSENNLKIMKIMANGNGEKKAKIMYRKQMAANHRK